MAGCVAYGCTNRTDGQRKPGVTYHLFPKDAVRRRAWIIAIKRRNFTPTRFSRLCSEHFAAECFDRSSKHFVRLKPNAVPTVFKNYPESLQNVAKMAPLSEFITEGDVVKKESIVVTAAEEEEEVEENIDDESLSESPSSEEESTSDDEPPETDVVYVSEERNEGEAAPKPPRIIKVVTNTDSGETLPKDPKFLDQDIKDALSAYTKFKGSSSIEELKGVNISLILVQPTQNEDEVSIFLKENGKLKSEAELLELYEYQKKEIKALRQKTFRFGEKVKKLEKIIHNFKNYKSEDENVDEDVSEEEISEEAIYEELRKYQKMESDSNEDVVYNVESSDEDADSNGYQKNYDNAKSNKDIKVESDSDANIESDDDANIESDDDANIESDDDADIECDNDADIECDNDADIECDNDADIECDNDEDIECDNEAEVECKKDADIKSEVDADIESEDDANIECEDDANIECEDDANIESNNCLNVENDNDVNIESDNINVASSIDNEVKSGGDNEDEINNDNMDESRNNVDVKS